MRCRGVGGGRGGGGGERKEEKEGRREEDEKVGRGNDEKVKAGTRQRAVLERRPVVLGYSLNALFGVRSHELREAAGVKRWLDARNVVFLMFEALEERFRFLSTVVSLKDIYDAKEVDLR